MSHPYYNFPHAASSSIPYPQNANVAPHPSHAPVSSHHQSLDPFDEMISKTYKDSTARLWSAVSHTSFLTMDHKQECEYILQRLRIYRHLFMHVYVHLHICCQGRDLQLLMQKANVWKAEGSVQQLVHYSSIGRELIALGQKYHYPCSHQTQFNYRITDDDNDLLCHLVYCRKKEELYNGAGGLGAGEYEQVIELIWRSLKNHQHIDILHRLRAQIYRMARKTAYIPHEMRIQASAISNQQGLGNNGAYGMITRAIIGGRQVAIKKILCTDYADRRKYLKMFASEAIIWKTLNHQNIVPFIGVVSEDRLDIRLVSPFYNNGSVRTYMKRPGFKYSSTHARTWAKGIAEALDYIHHHVPPIIHGDIKGDNVLVDDNGYARLGDFGQSHASDSGRYLDSTRVGLAAYTPVHWMAPEIMNGGDLATVTIKSDIYSFGCFLYEITSGKIPFENRTYPEVVSLVRHGQHPERPKTISENDLLWKTAKRCWQHRPEDRPSAGKIVTYFG